MKGLKYFTKQEKQIKETVEFEYFLRSGVYMALYVRILMITSWNSESKTEGHKECHRSGV